MRTYEVSITLTIDAEHLQDAADIFIDKIKNGDYPRDEK